MRDAVRASGRGEGVLGEELGDDGGDGALDRRPDRRHASYVRGVPVWATLLALERDGVVELGLVSAPALGRRWWALRGEGAFADGARCQVSSIAGSRTAPCRPPLPGTCRTAGGRSSQRAWSNRGLGDFWQHCLVAEGSVEIACDSVMHVWDYVPVQILVEEAGGRCTTFGGGEPAPLGSFVATNGRLHDEAVSLLRAEPGSLFEPGS